MWSAPHEGVTMQEKFQPSRTPKTEVTGPWSRPERDGGIQPAVGRSWLQNLSTNQIAWKALRCFVILKKKTDPEKHKPFHYSKL